MRTLTAVFLALSSVAITTSAYAQDQTDQPAEGGGGPTRPWADAQTDHESVVRRIGLHYFGSPTVTAINPMMPGMLSATTTPVHTVGLRLWFTPRIAFEAGIGLGYNGGSSAINMSGTVTTVGNPSEFAFGLTAGLPIALAYFRHINFYVAPFLSLYHGIGRFDENNGGAFTSYTVNSTRFQVGANVAAEVHLGFMRLPQVSLEVKFGLRLQVAADSAETLSGGTLFSGSVTNIDFGTTIQNWSFESLFTSSIAANYYF